MTVPDPAAADLVPWSPARPAAQKLATRTIRATGRRGLEVVPAAAGGDPREDVDMDVAEAFAFMFGHLDCIGREHGGWAVPIAAADLLARELEQLVTLACDLPPDSPLAVAVRRAEGLATAWQHIRLRLSWHPPTASTRAADSTTERNP